MGKATRRGARQQANGKLAHKRLDSALDTANPLVILDRLESLVEDDNIGIKKQIEELRMKIICRNQVKAEEEELRRSEGYC